MGIAKTFLAIGIAVIYVIFVAYGLTVFYEAPVIDYNIYEQCYKATACDDYFSECKAQIIENKTFEDPDCWSNVSQTEEYKACIESQDKCIQDLNENSDSYKYYRNSFYILIAIGLISMIAGMFIKLEGIGSGIMGGGILVVVWSLMYTASYWLTLSKYFRLFALGVVLAVLIYFGYKKLEDKTEKNKIGKKKTKSKK